MSEVGRLCSVAMIVVLGGGLGGCIGPSPRARSLHYVEGELVSSRPPAAGAYEAYLRARIAMSAEPPDLQAARAEIEVALRYDGRDPHLWTTRAEIAALAGDDEAAVRDAERALSLRPGYEPAQAVLSEIRGGPAAASVDPDG